MFDLGYGELMFVAIVALLVVGPKDLPKLMRTVGRMVGKVRSTARHFKSGMDEMVRQAELDEMREKWDKHNADIMRAAPAIPGDPPIEPPLDSPPTPASGTAPAPEPGLPEPAAASPAAASDAPARVDAPPAPPADAANKDPAP